MQFNQRITIIIIIIYQNIVLLQFLNQNCSVTFLSLCVNSLHGNCLAVTRNQIKYNLCMKI